MLRHNADRVAETLLRLGFEADLGSLHDVPN